MAGGSRRGSQRRGVRSRPSTCLVLHAGRIDSDPVREMRKLAVILLFLIAAIQTKEESPSKDVPVRHFERMAYPVYAKVRAIQGLVVIRASIGSSGGVVDAKVLSGPVALHRETLENIRKWAFEPSNAGDIIVVYWFRISGLCEPPCESAFEFHPPNFVIVTTGSMTVTP